MRDTIKQILMLVLIILLVVKLVIDFFYIKDNTSMNNDLNTLAPMVMYADSADCEMYSQN